MHKEVNSFRSVTADDWQRFRDLRLKALRDAPKAYGVAVEDVESTPDDEWKNLCQEACDEFSKIAYANGIQKRVFHSL